MVGSVRAVSNRLQKRAAEGVGPYDPQCAMAHLVGELAKIFDFCLRGFLFPIIPPLQGKALGEIKVLPYDPIFPIGAVF